MKKAKNQYQQRIRASSVQKIFVLLFSTHPLRFYSTLTGYFCVRVLHQSTIPTLMRRVSAKNTSVNQQHLVKYTQRVYIIVPIKDNCAIYYYFVNKRQWGIGHRAWGMERMLLDIERALKIERL